MFAQLNDFLYRKIGSFNSHKAIAMLYSHPYAQRYCRVIEREPAYYQVLEFLPNVLVGIQKWSTGARLHWNANLTTTIFIELAIPNSRSRLISDITKTKEMYIHFDKGCILLRSLAR